MNAVLISGELGKAIFRQNGELYELRPGFAPVPACPQSLSDILKFGSEYEVLENTNTDAIEDLLEKRIERHNALFLVVSLLDPHLSLSTRIIAAQSVEDLLGQPEYQRFVMQRLLSIPMPLETRVRRQEIMLPLSSFPIVRAAIREVFDSQPTIDQVRYEWEETLNHNGIHAEARSGWEAELVDDGLFSDVVQTVQARDLQALNSHVVKRAIESKTTEDVRNPTAILTDFRSRLQKVLFAAELPGRQRKLHLRSSQDDNRVSRPGTTDDFISELIAGLNDPNKFLTTRPISAYETKARVDKQISAIRDLLFAGKESLAQKYLEELLEFQLTHGERHFAAMSLCALTTISLDANQLEVAERLSGYAIKLDVNDPVVYGIRAEVFKHRGQFQNALKAYDEALARFPNARYLLNGRADVLQDLGRFDASLSAYAEAQQRYSDDPVAFSGRVGVLKAKGQFTDALRVAIQNTKLFPENSILRAALGSCLAAIGKFDEAAKHYKLAISLDPRNSSHVVACAFALKSAGKLAAALQVAESAVKKAPSAPSLWSLKAALLRAAGQFEESLESYEQAITKFPTYTPARFGGATVRILLGDSTQAQEILPSVNMESALDWYGYRAFALSFFTMGNQDEAVSRLKFGVNNCRWLKERLRLQTALGFVELQRKNTAASLRVLQENISELVYDQQQIRLLLLGHAHAQLGDTKVANTILNNIVKSRDHHLGVVRSGIVHCFRLQANVVALFPPQDTPDELTTAELNLVLAA
jgi:tetratricopeptide (TPR) repeat protein